MRMALASAVLLSLAALPPRSGAEGEEQTPGASETAGNPVPPAPRLTPGAHLIGKSVAGPSGNEVAHLEQQGAQVSLVVTVRGAAPARWMLPAGAARYRIFWTGPAHLVLGPSALEPRISVRWELASTSP
jgi:hypothetical protein